MNDTVKAGDNLFLELGFPPHEAEALKMRATLISTLRVWIQDSGLTQEEIALQLGVTQGRISDLVRGKWHKFSLDMLILLALRAGIKVDLRIAA
jgi:predicted XRE-type DNA-binding protein